MNESASSFHTLLNEIGEGSEDAVGRFLELYGDHLYRAVRRRLNRALRPKFDSEDFVQAVWASFFRDRAQLARFDKEGELIAFLTRLASNKVVDECRRRLHAQKTNVNRERSLDDEAQTDGVLPGREPTPSQVAIGKERWEQMTDGLPSHYRRLLDLRVAGETQEEIAKKLGVNEKTVRRVLQKVRNRLDQENEY
jgi:RNA polymerase sigma factor (sigma-70 family)